jgi:hypothetical protein
MVKCEKLPIGPWSFASLEDTFGSAPVSLHLSACTCQSLTNWKEEEQASCLLQGRLWLQLSFDVTGFGGVIGEQAWLVCCQALGVLGWTDAPSSLQSMRV